MTQISPRWRELLEHRVGEAVASLSEIPGMRGIVIGGSTGRGDPWPMSDELDLTSKPPLGNAASVARPLSRSSPLPVKPAP